MSMGIRKRAPGKLDDARLTFIEAMTASPACSKAEAVRVAIRSVSAHLAYEQIPRYKDPAPK